MENENAEVVVIEKSDIQPIKETLGNIQTIQKVLKEVMKLGCHYDKIQGCGDKPVLLKAGAEKILSTFRIGVEVLIEDLSGEYERRFRITCRGFFIPTGNTVGFGVGEGSTAEMKYAWRAAVCDEEFDETEETKRRKHWKKGYNGSKPTCINQVRQNPADITNTVLKMAKKRAMVDLCLTATACSDIFDQDLDESGVQAHIKEQGGSKTYKTPQSSSQSQEQHQNTVSASDCISENQAKRLYAIIMGQNDKAKEGDPNAYTRAFVDNWLRGVYEITEYKDTPSNVYEEICNHILNGTIPSPGA